MFYNILSEDKKKLLPALSHFKSRYYLAGGTALALQFGHRESEDFDFFTKDPFSTTDLFEKLERGFTGFELRKTQEEVNTLSVFVGNTKVSFFRYPYLLLEPLIKEKNINLASIADIGCMKCSSIVSRATIKDYVDLYFILQKISLKNLLEKCKEKLPSLDTNLILKSLVYFDDVIDEPIKYSPNHKISYIKVQSFLVREVKKYVELPS